MIQKGDVEKKIVEILLALILIIALMILIFSVIGTDNKQKSPATISNSFNTNTYNEYVVEKTPSQYYTKDNYYPKDNYYIKIYDSRNYDDSDYYYREYDNFYYKEYDDYYYKKNYDELLYLDEDDFFHYKSSGRIERAEGMFGNEIDKYVVNVKNLENKGGYFTVRIYLEDSDEIMRIERIKKYIPARESEIFQYKDIYADGYPNYKWHYNVISESR